MWWRSFRWEDRFALARCAPGFLSITSEFGEISILYLDRSWAGEPYSQVGYKIESGELTGFRRMVRRSEMASRRDPSFLGFRIGPAFSSHYLAMPYWFPVAFFTALAGLPWYGRYIRFGLRTLLILFTIVAAMLGYIVWALHSTVAG